MNHLTGYKGNSYIDSGYIFCPYVPLAKTPIIISSESDFMPVSKKKKTSVYSSIDDEWEVSCEVEIYGN